MVLPQAHNAAAPATSATTHSHHHLAGAGRSLMHSALSTWHRGARVLYCSSLTVVRPALVPPRCLLFAQTDYRCVCSRACCGVYAMAVVSHLCVSQPNWERRVDASSGREYFQNNVTHTTQWERPT